MGAERETQETIGRWIDATFPGADPASPRKALRLLEEAVELCLACGATIRDIEEKVDGVIRNYPVADIGYLHPEEVPAEAADVAIVLYGVAHLRGFGLHDEIDRKMKINREREWISDGDGTGHHRKNRKKDVRR